ncbi:MAG: autotransporter-associated beta strand repeat-containing protein [Lacunisphaera sp.]
MKSPIRLVLPILLLLISALGARAQITVTGGVTPSPGPGDSPVWDLGGQGVEIDAGSVTIAGAGSTLTGASGLYLVNGSLLTIETGGTAQVGTIELNNASISVTGTGSALNGTNDNQSLMIGDFDNQASHLTIAAGATGEFLETRIGYYGGGGGSVTVDGAGSSMVTSILAVGDGAPARLTVSNGGYLRSTNAYIGLYNFSSEITVTGAGSRWDTSNNDYLYIGSGQQSTGKLTVADGGTVEAGGTYFILGQDATNTGEVLVTGAGSVLHAGGFMLGMQPTATGTVTVEAGGTVVSHDIIYVGTGGTGTLNVTGAGTNLNAGAITVGLDGGEGTLTIAADAQVEVGNGTGDLYLSGSPDEGAGHGTLNIGNGGAAGTLLAGRVTGLENPAMVNFNHTGNLTFAPVLAGTIAVTKLGSGTLSLTGANTYVGGTTITGGGLYANNLSGSAFGSGPVLVQSGATLGGAGFIGGPTTIASGGHLAPGNSPGDLTFTSGLTLESGAQLDFQLGTISDRILVTGGTLEGPAALGTITLNLSNAGGFAPGTYTLFDFTGATLNNFGVTDFTFGTTIPGYDFSLALGGNTLNLTANFTPVPEPSTYALLALGVGALVAFRNRRLPVRVMASVEPT